MTDNAITVHGWEEANALLQRLLTQDSLYSYLILDANGPFLTQMLYGSYFASFDYYCPFCKMVTTYQIRTGQVINKGTQTRYSVDPEKSDIVVLNAVCLRINHSISYVLLRAGDRITKIGQMPSLADVAFAELKEVGKGLDAIDRKELGRALGLFSHDAPLGAFVYLRRVFERMILRAHGRHVSAGHPAIEGFADLPMDKRIREIRDQLPPRVVQHSQVFQVLSKGIHELSDEEARDLFPLVKTIIFQMLGDEERHRLAAEQDAATEAAFSSVLQRLAAKTKPELIGDQSAQDVE